MNTSFSAGNLSIFLKPISIRVLIFLWTFFPHLGSFLLFFSLRFGQKSAIKIYIQIKKPHLKKDSHIKTISIILFISIQVTLLQLNPAPRGTGLVNSDNAFIDHSHPKSASIWQYIDRHFDANRFCAVLRQYLSPSKRADSTDSFESLALSTPVSFGQSFLSRERRSKKWKIRVCMYLQTPPPTHKQNATQGQFFKRRFEFRVFPSPRLAS